jgi:hypothetical protein
MSLRFCETRLGCRGLYFSKNSGDGGGKTGKLDQSKKPKHNDKRYTEERRRVRRYPSGGGRN